MTKRANNKRHFFRKLIWVFTILIILLVASGFLFQSYYAEKVKSIVLHEINQQLAVGINVGDIEFTIFKDFPNASLRFSEVSSKQKDENQSKDPLIKAKTVSILFNVWDIVSGDYTISKIQLSDAFLTIVDYGNGKNNYQLGKGTGQPEGEGANININKIILKNVHILYINYPSDQEYLLQTAHSEISGQFSQKNYSLLIDGDIFSEHVKSGKASFLTKKNIKLSLLLKVDRKEHLYEIKKGKLSVSGLPLSLEGVVKGKQKSRTFGLSVVCEKTKLKSLLQEIPAQYLKPINGLGLSGKIGFSASIKGKFSGDNLPLIDLKFSVSEGQIKMPVSEMDLKNVALKGSFSNGDHRAPKSFKLSVSHFNAKLETGDISGKLTINNFVEPDISVEAKTNLELKELHRYFKFKEVEVVSGRISLDIAFQKKLYRFDKFTVSDFISSRAQGAMSLKNGKFRLKDSHIDFHGFEGDFSFNNKDLIVDRLSGNLSTSDFTLKGKFKNLTPWLFMPDEKIVIDAGFTSANINLDELLLVINNETDPVYKLAFNDRVKFDLRFEVDNFSFRKFRAENVKGDIGFKDRKLRLSETSFQSMDGNSTVSGLIDGAHLPASGAGYGMTNNYLLKCNADIRKVNIRKLFYQLGNFGQDNITSVNLNGEASANIYFVANMDTQLRISPESVYASSDIVIENGELMNYKPLYSLAKFIKIDELKDIRFSKLQNQIEIKDRVIFIPQMEINSSTLNVQLQGSHTFDNKIDYHFSLLLSEFLHRKKKQQEDKDYIIHEDKNGEPRIYLSMTGAASNPQIKYDTKAVRSKIKSDFEKERENLKEVFKDEFSGNKGDKPEREEKGYFEKVDSTQHDFIIEWEDDPGDSLNNKKQKTEKTPEKKLPVKKDKDFIISFDEDDEPTPKGAGNST